MKLSIILPDLRGGGVERIRIVLAHEFAMAGYDVEFVLMQARGELLPEAQASFPVVDLATPRARVLPLALARYLRRRRPDAVLAAMWPLTGIAGLAMRLSGYSCRLVASEHVDFRSTPSHKVYERWALKHFGPRLYGPCHSIVAVSAGVAESLKQVASLPPDKVKVIHNPVRPLAPEYMSESDFSLLEGWLKGEVRLIAIGSLKHQKGFDVLLNSLVELRQHVDAHLLILGDGPLRSELEDLAARLGIRDRLCMPGFRSNPGTFLKFAHLFVLSSRWEGFGNVVVEALGAGVPVVSTDCPSGPAEILENGRYGRLVTTGDPSSLASGIKETLSEPFSAGFLKARAEDFQPHLKAALYLKLLTCD